MAGENAVERCAILDGVLTVNQALKTRVSFHSRDARVYVLRRSSSHPVARAGGVGWRSVVATAVVVIPTPATTFVVVIIAAVAATRPGTRATTTSVSAS